MTDKLKECGGCSLGWLTTNECGFLVFFGDTFFSKKSFGIDTPALSGGAPDSTSIDRYNVIGDAVGTAEEDGYEVTPSRKTAVSKTVSSR